MVESVLILIAIVLMFLSLPLIIIPAVPVSALEWTIAIVFATLTGFERLTPAAALIATVFMLIGSTSGLWMPFFGLKGKEISCLGMVGFFSGMIIGGIVIPIPLVGSVIGGIIAVFLVQVLQQRKVKKALHSSGTALKLMLYGIIAEFVFAALIIGVFLFSVTTTS